MINISEKEFFEYLEKYANKEITMTKLVKELETEPRTLNNKIIEISVINPDLYYKIITNNPYKQKSRADIDFEALMIYIIKNRITNIKATEIFNVSRKTIQRRTNKIKDTNPKLFELYKLCTGKNKSLLDNPIIQERIEKLEYKDVVVGERNEERERILLNLERSFNEYLESGMTRDQAARKLGYTRDSMNKVLNELYRLEIEKNTKKDSKSKEFRENLSDMSQYDANTINQQVIKEDKTPNINNNEAR